MVGFESKLPHDPDEFDSTIRDFHSVAAARREDGSSKEDTIGSIQSLERVQGSAAFDVDPERAGKRSVSRREALQAVFGAFDLDGSGWVDRDELMELGVARCHQRHDALRYANSDPNYWFCDMAGEYWASGEECGPKSATRHSWPNSTQMGTAGSPPKNLSGSLRRHCSLGMHQP